MAGSGSAVDRYRAQIVVANDRRGSSDQLDIGDRTQWNEIALRGAYPHSKDVFDPFAIGCVSLDLDLPSAAKPIEVIDVGAAHSGLQCAEDGSDGDTQRLGPLAV